MAQVLGSLPNEYSDPSVLRALDDPDDAAVYRVAHDQAIVQTVDFFTPIVDDPFDWGRIAASNALSDIYAMGARPTTALSLVAWPRALPFEVLGRVLEGAADACREAETAIVGGHSIDDPEPKFGLAVTGLVHPDRIVNTRGARPGDDLVLTKALGTGVISTAIKQEKATTASVRDAVASMSTLNRDASEVMVEVGVHAATDVTGFGLVGHLLTMLGEDLDAHLQWSSLPVLEGAVEFARRDLLPGGSKRNRKSTADRVDAHELQEEQSWMLFDAQTSGGLLIATDPERAHRLLKKIHERGNRRAARIGRLEHGSGSIRVSA